MVTIKKAQEKFSQLREAGESVLTETKETIPELHEDLSDDDYLIEHWPGSSDTSLRVNVCGYEFLCSIFIDSQMFLSSASRGRGVEGWDLSGRYKWEFLDRKITTPDGEYETEEFKTLRFTIDGDLWNDDLGLSIEFESSKVFRTILKSGMENWPSYFPLRFLF